MNNFTMLNKILLILITIMLSFISFALYNISKEINKKIETKPVIEPNLNPVIQIEPVNKAEPIVMESTLPEIWKNITNEDIKKVVLYYPEKDLSTVTQISKILEESKKDFSVFLEYNSMNQNSNKVSEKEKAFKNMHALLILLSPNVPLNLEMNEDYQFAIQNKIPVILLSTTSINTEELSKYDNIIQVDLEGINTLNQDVMQMLNKMEYQNTTNESEDIFNTQL